MADKPNGRPPVKVPAAKEEPTLKGLVSDSRLLPMLTYALIFMMVMTMGISGILALLIATFAEDGAPDWIKSHYVFIKRTFWIGVMPVIAIFALGTFFARHGMVSQMYSNTLLALMFICLLFIGGRAVMGFNHLFYNRPYPNPKTWLI